MSNDERSGYKFVLSSTVWREMCYREDGEEELDGSPVAIEISIGEQTDAVTKLRWRRWTTSKPWKTSDEPQPPLNPSPIAAANILDSNRF